ncbi:substrate-binding domain-containing protein [Paenibacillus sp. V4I7]|uniref:substrate-binding domain-containing protein n=1 Tax=Paenibacillus sp. V4I7 TaxID=3042307 RepID=UPI002785D30B|nr:substrate-binding domain-containing protein [Paenibacillus sp. V4I7]MDQ0903604.1 DNA-binding LacI/PurR family transcriptional regulator [Paenibacillus sp. V4I7]
MRFRIFEAANQLNYRTDTKTKKKRGNLLVLIPENIRNDQIFYYEVFWSIEKRAKENGYNAIICGITQAMEDQLILPELYHEIVFDGILLVDVLHLNYVRKLVDLGIPLVTVDHYYDSLQLDAVVTANAEEAYKIVTHLIDKGHRQIGFIGAISRTKSFKERWSGYQNAMSDAGLAIDMNHNIVNPSPLEALNSTTAQLTDHLDAMTSMPTAWFCADDRIAISLIQILISKDYKVPKDISVVGFGDIEAAQMIAPHLTTIKVQREQLGIEAVDFLIRKIDFGGSPAKISIYGELIERDSCKALG